MTFWNRAQRWLGIELVAVSAAERLSATVGGGNRSPDLPSY